MTRGGGYVGSKLTSELISVLVLLSGRYSHAPLPA
jgi:hypothetical protein